MDAIQVNPGNASDDINIYYLGDNRQKRIVWAGATDGTEDASMNQLYSGLMDHFDESLQMDDGIPMSAQTPVEYTIGKIDAGDNDPWYISYKTMEFLNGGALQTSGWTRVQDSNTGIIVVPVTSNAIVTGDIGNGVSNGSDTGTLLDVIEGGTIDYLVIRPTNSTSTHNWDTGSGTVTEDGSSHTATQDDVAVTGEQIWANLYSIGTIEPDTHIYVYQGASDDDATRERLYSIDDSTQDWWCDGHIDICVPIRDYKVSGNPIIDGAYCTVAARKYTNLYDMFEVANSTTSGGRNPIPFGTAPDLDNTTGYKSITYTDASTTAGHWNVGDEILGGTSGARAIITKIDNPETATQTVHYYLIDDPLTDFNTAAETRANQDASGTGSKDGNAPADQGPGLTTWFTDAEGSGGAGGSAVPTITFGDATADIDDDSVDEYYGITLDCNGCRLGFVYEWIKYATRRGAIATTNGNGIPAELYVGGECYLATGTVTNTLAEGESVTQATSGATGVVVSYNAANEVVLLRNVRGIFSTAYQVDSDDSTAYFTPVTAQTFSPKKQSPFGTFAGGTFFGARGVKLLDWDSQDENLFQLTPIEGGTKTRPKAYVLSLSNLIGTDEDVITDDRVACFRLTGSGGDLDKTEYTAVGTGAIGDTSLVIDSAITTNTPGKTTGGIVRIRDTSDNSQEYRLRYDSWATSTFTLSALDVASADAGTDTTTIVEAGAFADIKRGDLVYNVTRSAVSYVVSVADDTNSVDIYPAIASQTTADNIKFNCLPIAPAADDDVYVPLLDTYADAVSESVSIITGDVTIYFKAVCRNVANATPIKPFAATSSITSANVDIPIVRTEDSIYT